MADFTKAKVGDIVAVYGIAKPLPKAITLWMKIYRWKLKVKPRNVYHHIGTVIFSKGRLCIAEADAPVYKIRPRLEAYNIQEWEDNVDIYTPFPAYTQEEQNKISEQAELIALRGTIYDIPNFWFQILKIITGVWKGKEGLYAEDTMYCSEAAATLANKVRRGTFANPAAVNPIDFVINPYFTFVE